MTALRRLWPTLAVALAVVADVALARAPLPGRAVWLMLLAMAQLGLLVATTMRLQREPRALQLAFVLPLVLMALYAVTIVAEARFGVRPS